MKKKISEAGKRAIGEAQRRRWARIHADNAAREAPIRNRISEPWPTVVIPQSAKGTGVDDGDAEGIMTKLAHARAAQLIDYQRARYADSRSGRTPSVEFLPPVKNELGYYAAFGLKCAQRERTAVLDIVGAHLKGLKVVEDMLIGFGALLRKCEMPQEVDEVQAVLSHLGSLREDITKSVVNERGALRTMEAHTLRVKWDDKEWSLAE